MHKMSVSSLDCGGTYRLTETETSVTFTSPGYPANYPNKLECIWTIEVFTQQAWSYFRLEYLFVQSR